MKLFNIENSAELFNVINECNGKIELIKEDGSRLNLKSKLTQNILSIQEEYPELNLAVYDSKDISRLLAYAMGIKYVA